MYSAPMPISEYSRAKNANALRPGLNRRSVLMPGSVARQRFANVPCPYVFNYNLFQTHMHYP